MPRAYRGCATCCCSETTRFDPSDWLGLGRVSYMPSLYAWDGQFGRVPSENLYADVDGDGAPDVAIGRLPAQTPEDAEAMVAKIARQADVLRRRGGASPASRSTTRAAPTRLPKRRARRVGRRPARRAPPKTWADVGEGADAARAALIEGLPPGPGDALLRPRRPGSVGGRGAARGRRRARSWRAARARRCSSTWACEAQWLPVPLGAIVGEALLLPPRGRCPGQLRAHGHHRRGGAEPSVFGGLC